MTQHPLRKILSIQSVLIAILPFIVMAIIGFSWVIPLYTSDLKSHQIELGMTIASQIDSHLAASRIVLTGISNVIKNQTDETLYHEIISAQLQAFEFMNVIYVVNSEGKIISVSLNTGNLSQQKDLLESDVSNVTFYQDVKNKKEPMWSETFLSIVGGGLSVAYAIPVADKIVVCEIDLVLLTDYLRKISSSQEQLIFILDQRGQVIADQDGRFTAQQLNLRNLEIIREGLGHEESQVDTFIFDGNKVLGSFIKIQNLDWYILVMIPADIVYRSIWTTVGILALTLFVTIAVGIVFAITFSQRLAQRFESLADHTRKVAAGEVITRWPLFNITEFREFSEDLRHMADTIRDREEYNRILFDDSPIPLVVINPVTAEFLDCNDAALRLYQLSSGDDYRKKTTLDFSPQFQDDGIKSSEAASKYGQLCISQGYVSFEWKFKNSEGDFWYGEVNLTQFHHGETLLMQYSIKDITSQKYAAEEFKKLEDQLKQAQKMESIGTLAGGIAHDFNNILFPMLGYTEMMLNEVSGDTFIKNSLEEVLKGILRARDLVKQILEFSRQADHEYKPVDCDVILKEVLQLSRSTLPSTIELQQDIQQNCGQVLADPTHLHQIVMNLITNAFHAMEKQGGVLKVSLSVTDSLPQDQPDKKNQYKSYIRLGVSDTGTGMEQSTVKKIFDPYFTTKEQGKGTGLGLSVVHGIVNTYNGFIHVDSEIGKGTEFTIYLPRIYKKKVQEITSVSKSDILHGEETVLLVDDEIPILNMFEKMLLSLNYKVVPTNDSLQALKMFGDDPRRYHLLITDMTMPGLTGDKLAAEIKKKNPVIPVILCTGFSELVSEENVADSGIDRVLMKPIIRQDLAQAIREVLDK